MVLLLTALSLAVGCRDGKEARRDLASIEALLQEGDIVFRRGSGATSRAVLAADKGGVYSHIGIVVRLPLGRTDARDIGDGEQATAGSDWRIVHIVPGEPDACDVRDRIKMERPEDFFAHDRAVEGAVMRVEAETKDEATGEDDAMDGIPARAARRALKLAATELAFDHDYDLSDTTRMYCTELVHHVFMCEGLDLTAGKRSRLNAPVFSGDYIFPTDILRNSHLKTIYRF